MLNLYIRTRGLRTDYHFLLKQPPKIPSPNDYRSDIEQPTCILEWTQENPGYIFLSGIPSSRKDYQGTPIYYDFVATWEKNEKVERSEELTKLISTWLDEVKEALQETREDGKKSYQVRLPIAQKSKLTELLDKALAEQYVEELLQLTIDRDTSSDKRCTKYKELNKKLTEEFLEKIQTSKQNNSEDSRSVYEAWYGGIKNSQASEIWINLVREILKGEIKGKALLLNIANDRSFDILCQTLKGNESLGLLLAKEFAERKLKKKEIPQPSKEKPLLTSIAFILVMTGVSLFLGFSLLQAQVKIAELSWGTKQISWETSYQDEKLQLKIKGRINQSELQPKEICILPVVNQEELYVDGKPKENKNLCQKSSIANLEKDGTWNFEYTFKDQNHRTIRVEEIYNNKAPKNYIDFTIGKKNNQ